MAKAKLCRRPLFDRGAAGVDSAVVKDLSPSHDANREGDTAGDSTGGAPSSSGGVGTGGATGMGGIIADASLGGGAEDSAGVSGSGGLLAAGGSVGTGGSVVSWDRASSAGSNGGADATPIDLLPHGMGGNSGAGGTSVSSTAPFGSGGFASAAPDAATDMWATRFTQVWTGGYHTCGIKTDGSVVCWGKDDIVGLLPAPPAGPFAEISVGYYFACGVRPDDSWACWGQSPALPRYRPDIPTPAA